jgi:cupin fold WbuC family metalloprotein
VDDPWINYIDGNAIGDLIERARQSPRHRLNLNLHPRLDDPIQRFVNAGEPGSYVRPHRHQSDRWELVMALRGHVNAVIFDETGAVVRRHTLKAGGAGIIQLPGSTWHSFVFIEAGSVAFEVKPGPYDARTDKMFAAWAPKEGASDVPSFVRWLETAPIGSHWRTLPR